MPAERTHEYRITTHWTGNLGSGTSAYNAYSRAHECTGDGKSAPIPGSSDPAFRGDPARYSPEELLVAPISHRSSIDTSVDAANTSVCATPAVNSLFPLNRGARSQRAVPALLPACLGRTDEKSGVGALSTCHMLWVLHLCADAGIVVTEYADQAWGEMVEHADGSGEMTRVLLRPRMRITDSGRAPEVAAIHDRAHAVCCLARSVRFPVRHEPVVLICGGIDPPRRRSSVGRASDL
jgi:organic hydroperoxide reductase OsmC/OhrA